MDDKKLGSQEVAYDESRVKHRADLTLWQAITMSVVSILAVAAGTIYGTILF